MKLVHQSFVLAALTAAAAPAAAQFAKPEDAVKYRKAAFTVMGNHMGRIGAQLKSGKPNAGSIQASAAIIETMSKLPYEAFLPDTDMIGDTKAKPEIWTDAAKFADLRDKMQAEVVKLGAAARSGDMKAVGAQFGTVGEACKACHDQYRAK